MNEKNLIPMSERSKRQRRKIARNGGIASGKARRRKKLLKEILALSPELNVEAIEKILKQEEKTCREKKDTRT